MATLVTTGGRLVQASLPLGSPFGGLSGLTSLLSSTKSTADAEGRSISFWEIYESQPIVAAAVNKLTRQIATLPLKVYRKDAQNGRERVTDTGTTAFAWMLNIIEKPAEAFNGLGIISRTSMAFVAGGRLLQRSSADALTVFTQGTGAGSTGTTASVPNGVRLGTEWLTVQMTSTTTGVCVVDRFANDGSSRVLDMTTAAGYWDPLITTDGAKAYLFMRKGAATTANGGGSDDVIVKYEYMPGVGWGSESTVMAAGLGGTFGAGGYTEPNGVRNTAGNAIKWALFVPTNGDTANQSAVYALVEETPTGTTATRTAADTVAVSDSAARAGSGPRTAADTVATSDAATRLRSGGRTATDAVTASDQAAGTLTRPRSATDTVSVTDAATRLRAGGRTAADTVSRSDAATRTVGRPRAATDSTSVSDTSTGVFGSGTTSQARTATDTASVADTATRLRAGGRSGTDTVSATDTATRVKAGGRGATDSTGVTDTAAGVTSSGATSLTRTATDSVSVADSASRAQPFTRTAADTVARSDSAARGLASNRTAGDSLTVSDTATRGQPFTRGATDIVAVSDNATGEFGAFGAYYGRNPSSATLTARGSLVTLLTISQSLATTDPKATLSTVAPHETRSVIQYG